MTNTVSRAQVVRYLQAVLPEVDAVLTRMEKNGGWLRLRPPVVKFLTQLKIANYAELYVDERRIWALFAIAMAGEADKVRELLREIEKA